jgi:hypothetical protein
MRAGPGQQDGKNAADYSLPGSGIFREGSCKSRTPEFAAGCDFTAAIDKVLIMWNYMND